MARRADDAEDKSSSASGLDDAAELGTAELDASELDAGAEEADEADTAPALSDEALALWTELRLSPVEIAFPSGVGLTLRHYRTVIATDDEPDDDEPDDGEPDDGEPDDGLDTEPDDGLDTEPDDDEPDDDEPNDDGDMDSVDPGGEEVEEAVFLAQDGRLHLFRSADGLVEFIRSTVPHDLNALATWSRAVKEITVDTVVPAKEDRYELDLVVENLRGGRDVWEPDLLIAAGEVARDLGYALELDVVLQTLAPGSPLDELDEGLRSRGFLARRRLRRIGAEQAALAWRSIIGKLSAAVEWHD